MAKKSALIVVVLLAAGVAALAWIVLSSDASPRTNPARRAPTPASFESPSTLDSRSRGRASPVAAPSSSTPAKAPMRGGSDLDTFAAELSLTPQEREHVRQIFLERDQELDQALHGLGSDPKALDRATDAVLERARARVREALDPDKRARFDALVGEGR